MRLTSSLDERHPYAMAGLRFAVGGWLIILFGLLASINDWWGAFLLLPAAISVAVGVLVLHRFGPRSPSVG